MGFGLPAALGVKLALPNETVVCVTGDGSIQMNIQELSTALQYELPVLVLNLNNGYLGMVKQWQDMIYSGRHSQSYMQSLPDFVRLAEAYGHVGMRVTDPALLESSLAQALEQVKTTASSLWMSSLMGPSTFIRCIFAAVVWMKCG